MNEDRYPTYLEALDELEEYGKLLSVLKDNNIESLEQLKQVLEEYQSLLKKQNKSSLKKAEQEQIESWFKAIWEIYPKKEGKQGALKTFTTKLKGLKTEEQRLEKARKIAKIIQIRIKEWTAEGREKQYIPMLQTLLNREVPN